MDAAGGGRLETESSPSVPRGHMSDELIRLDAIGIVERLKRGEVTPHDLLDALEKRIAAVERPGQCAADAVLRSGARSTPTG